MVGLFATCSLCTLAMVSYHSVSRLKDWVRCVRANSRDGEGGRVVWIAGRGGRGNLFLSDAMWWGSVQALLCMKTVPVLVSVPLLFPILNSGTGIFQYTYGEPLALACVQVFVFLEATMIPVIDFAGFVLFR